MIYKNSIHPYQTRQEITLQTLENVVEQLQNDPPGRQRAWRALNYYGTHYDFEMVFPSHQKIANEARISVTYLKECIKLFKQRGWIKTKQRWNKSLIYFFDSIFRSSDVQKAMSLIFISLAFTSALLVTPQKAASNRECLLSNIKNFLYIKNISESQRVYTVGAREKSPENPRCVQKKETVMSNLTWSREVSELHKQLPLKDHGFAKLSAFPAEAIHYARLRIAMVYKAQTPFQYLVKVCEAYCEQNNIKPDWAQYKKLQEVMKVSIADDYVDNQLLQKIIANEAETTKNLYHQGDIRKPKDKATEALVLKARVEGTNSIVNDRLVARSKRANRDEIIAGISACDWGEYVKNNGSPAPDPKKSMEFLELMWPAGGEPDIVGALSQQSLIGEL